MYGSHDSLTGYPVRKWWMKLFQLFSKTQSLSIGSQIKLGVEFFDIRVRFNKEGTIIGCHGLVEYKVFISDIIKTLENEHIPYRVVLENKLGGRKCKKEDLTLLKDIFLSDRNTYCYYVSDKKNWNTEYNPYYKGIKPNGEYNCTGIIIPAWTHKWKLRVPFSKLYTKNNWSQKVYWYDFVQKL